MKAFSKLVLSCLAIPVISPAGDATKFLNSFINHEYTNRKTTY